MRQVLAAALWAICASQILRGQDRLLWSGLQRGQYQVGYRSRFELDPASSSRWPRVRENSASNAIIIWRTSYTNGYLPTSHSRIQMVLKTGYKVRSITGDRVHRVTYESTILHDFHAVQVMRTAFLCLLFHLPWLFASFPSLTAALRTSF